MPIALTCFQGRAGDHNDLGIPGAKSIASHLAQKLGLDAVDVFGVSWGGAIAQHVVANAKPGDIILLHVMDGSCRASLEAVPGIIEGLKAQGFQFVTVSELLAAESSR